MARPPFGAAPVARAPRLRSDERIAGHITRVGRFRKLDPAHGRPLPSVWALLGRFGWALLVVESLRRAWGRAREAGQAPGHDEGAASSGSAHAD